ncbi:hypothetical protein AAMO2058_001067000 [Amorphochlora amoebiformis]
MRIKAEIDKYRAEARLRKRGFISSSRRRDLILLLSGLVAAAFTLSILVMVSYTLLDTEVETHRLGAKLWGGSKNRFDSGRAGRRTPSRRDTPPGPERKWDIDVSEGGRSSSMWSSDRFKGSRERLRGNDWDGYFPYAQGGPWYRELGGKMYKLRRHTPRHTPLWWFGGDSGEAMMRFHFPKGEPKFIQPAYEGQDWNETYWGREKKTPLWTWKLLDFAPTFLPFVIWFGCFLPYAGWFDEEIGELEISLYGSKN